MAEVILTNVGDFTALYGDEPIDFSTNTVSTTIISGITPIKSVDKEFWVNGPLTYTITVENTTGVDLTNVVLIDSLDIDHVTFNTDFGVLVNGVPSVYTYAASVVSVELALLTSGSTVVIEFQVVRV